MRPCPFSSDPPCTKERDPAPSCQIKIPQPSLPVPPSTKTEARFDDGRIGDGLGEKEAVEAVTVTEGSPLIGVVKVSGKETLLDIVIALETFCIALVGAIKDAVMVVTDCVIVSLGRVLIIKMDFRVNVTASITQLKSVETTVITIANGSIFFR
ncbi:hypothetical protein Trco_004979 [Trichoderma cornu-damae]|uniref:Uncharacterized protein n=1 Tax=Trichoderma cornu-damae TaxID=654480 RepID=A0A9P8TSC0_9HYPO|nr:hypothetical protein Trco_004979 [Trichoderma cornu-damae]